MSRTAAHTWQLPSPDFNGVCSTSGPSRSTGGTNSDVEQVAAGQRGTGCFNGRQMVSLHILSLKQKDTTLDVTGNPTRWRAFWLGSERQTKAFVTSSFLSLLVWHLLLLAMHLLLLAMRGVWKRCVPVHSCSLVRCVVQWAVVQRDLNPPNLAFRNA